MPTTISLLPRPNMRPAVTATPLRSVAPCSPIPRSGRLAFVFVERLRPSTTRYKLRRDQRLAVTASRDAGPVLDQAHLIAGHRAVDFRLRARPQHDGDVIGARPGNGALKTVGHRQEGEQHDHHQRDRDHRRQRQPASLPHAPEIDRGDRHDLQQKRTHDYPRPSAVAILSRMALSAGMMPVIRPSAIISAIPCSAITGDTAKAGAILDRLVAQRQRDQGCDRQSRQTAEQRQQHQFAQHHSQDSPAREAERLQHADLPRTFAYRQRHGVADDHQDGDEGGADHQEHDQGDVAELGRERLAEGLFGVGRGLRGGIGEHRIDGFCDTVVILGRVGLQNHPADRCPCRTNGFRRNRHTETA